LKINHRFDLKGKTKNYCFVIVIIIIINKFFKKILLLLLKKNHFFLKRIKNIKI
jgi:hypothetical protein